ncbi:hypothetical protein HanXRQr2_Chr16g0743991 [Helianthus annuus]|uniref:Uncharacterized protein n=1 Tax=Helianthus annuus TaxID=4232 RepID=A0A251RX43_HELAN|nr:hypothetical protein HanXRQr2_Chr16g0743991 [Helianthus annuus]KAJ0442393.1 hypothetical protein HanIR_Chr16g0808711 [Helianthus annuus]KAJ0820889.1 hypothetical protein HanPSC8_Chr16g0713371 [Helianthus annuus]
MDRPPVLQEEEEASLEHTRESLIAISNCCQPDKINKNHVNTKEKAVDDEQVRSKLISISYMLANADEVV